MNWEAIGTIAEVVSATAVIVSLLYLGYQVRQNTAQSRFDSTHDVVTRMNQAFDPIYSPENTRLFNLGLEDPHSLTPGEKRIFELLVARIISSLDSATSAHDHGLVPTELYAGLVMVCSSLIATPGGTVWYTQSREYLSPATRAKLDGAVLPDHGHHQ
jgi:hypothetical protein